ncbi:TonB-dependent receptor [Novilysobacter erysipheiresistens]|uniref:TonB-dependent receptor n=1 Tax=Novilysobacter erysipheiresistens TaxID=1749332 RepID=A0ABU7YWC3_9GAMM
MNSKAFKRTALSIAMGLGLASLAPMALAQDGSVVGQSQAGAQVTVTNPQTGFSRTVTANSDGSYRFPFLPVGTYQLQTSVDGRPVGEPVQVRVALGSATVVNAASGGAVSTLGTVEVTGSRVVNAVDVTSTESSTNVTREEIERLPVDQDIASVAQLAPGVQKGDASFGGISFGGSSVAENSFYINGLNVTDFYNRVGFSSAPFAFYKEFQVKTGGYSVEFGRSTGGVVNAVTRSGTNEFNFGTELTLEPRRWQAESENRYAEDGTRYITASEDNYSRTKLNFYASGPIVKDKLFFFAMFEARDYQPQNTNNAGTTLTRSTSDDGFWGGKVDWQISNNHLLEFMGFSDQNTSAAITSAYDFETGAVTDPSEPVFFESGGKNWNTTYTGYLTDALSMKLMYGETERNNSQYSPSDLECSPVVQEVTDEFPDPGIPLGCTTSTRVEARLDERTAMRADFEWQVGDHLLRFGADHEENISNYDRHYPGPDQTFYSIEYLDTPGAAIPDSNGAVLPPGENVYVRARQYGVDGQFETINSAFYLEDNWQVTRNVLLNLGIRQEAFDNKDSDGNSYIKMDDMWAPRLGFSWDMRGDGRTKLFGNAGRYFLPVANVINIKQAGGFLDARAYHAFEGYIQQTRNGFTYLMPVLGEQLGFDNSQGDGTVGDLRSEVDADMDPVFQDEFILGFEQALSESWSYGIQGTYRELNNAIDDMEISATHCGRNGPGWVMANPGEEVTFWGDTDCDGENDGYVTVDTSQAGAWTEHDNYIYVADVNTEDANPDDPGWAYSSSTPTGQTGWVKPERTYKSIELQIDRAWDDKWAFNASYVWSKSEGNAEGPVNSDTEFADAGRTENFDDPWVNLRGYGYLANDRRHQLKLRGAYALAEHWRVGASVNAQTGGPITGFGVGNPFNWDTYHSYFICVEACSPEETVANPQLGDTWSTDQRVFEHSPRGSYGTMPSTYVVNASLAYERPLAFGEMAIKLSVYNLFNQQREIDVNQDLQESVDGGLNANFLRPVRFQSPRYAQLTFSLDF